VLDELLASQVPQHHKRELPQTAPYPNPPRHKFRQSDPFEDYLNAQDGEEMFQLTEEYMEQAALDESDGGHLY